MRHAALWRKPSLTGPRISRGRRSLGYSDETSTRGRLTPATTEAQYRDEVASLFPIPLVTAKVLARYPAADYSPWHAHVAITSDAKFVCDTRCAPSPRARRLHIATRSSMCLDNASPFVQACGAPHGVDVL